jgi:hypothetical protein
MTAGPRRRACVRVRSKPLSTLRFSRNRTLWICCGQLERLSIPLQLPPSPRRVFEPASGEQIRAGLGELHIGSGFVFPQPAQLNGLGAENRRGSVLVCGKDQQISGDRCIQIRKADSPVKMGLPALQPGVAAKAGAKPAGSSSALGTDCKNSGCMHLEDHIERCLGRPPEALEARFGCDLAQSAFACLRTEP